MSPTKLLILGITLLITVSIGSVFVGVSDIGPGDILVGDTTKTKIFVESRVPRLFAILLSGSAMAVSGLIMQSLARNKFVSPTTIGTIDAANLGVLVATLWFGPGSVLTKMAVAILVSLVASGFLVVLVQRLRISDIIVVPLVGIMFGGLLQAITVLLAMRFDVFQAVGAWTIGDFSAVLQGRYELLYLVGALTVICYCYAQQFTVASLGRDTSINLGFAYERTLVVGLVLVSIVTSVVVVVVGAVPFLGLVVPNVVTSLLGDNLRRVLPVTAVAGALLVLVCDVFGRLVQYPHEVPAGTIAGVVGSAIFVIIIVRGAANASPA